MTVLVTGASGTVGSALVPALSSAGEQVRVLTRDANQLERFPWAADVDIVEGDAVAPEHLVRALDGVEVAYYLIHGLSGADPERLVDEEVARAEAFRQAAAETGVSRIVYLGGLVPDVPLDELSPHMRSRVEVGQALAGGPAEVCELRAAVVIGAGSDSFELLAAVAERLPATPAPGWARTRTQPIALDDVVVALLAAHDRDRVPAGVFDVGGPDVVDYVEMVETYRELVGLGAIPTVDLPFVPSEIAGVAAGVIADLDVDLATALFQSAGHDAVVGDRPLSAHVELPATPFIEALRTAIEARRSAAG